LFKLALVTVFRRTLWLVHSWRGISLLTQLGSSFLWCFSYGDCCSEGSGKKVKWSSSWWGTMPEQFVRTLCS